MAGDGPGLPQRPDQLTVDVVDLDRRKTQARQPGRLAGLADESGQRIAILAVAVAAEVDARKDDLAVPLAHSAADLRQDRGGAAAPRSAADERNDTEVAREAATVLDLDERSHSLRSRFGADAAERAELAGDERRSVLRRARDDGHVLGHARERGAAQIRTAPRHVDVAVRPRRTRDGMARLPDRLVRDPARVDDCNVAFVGEFAMTFAKQAFPHGLYIGLRNLAAEEADGKARHGG